MFKEIAKLQCKKVLGSSMIACSIAISGCTGIFTPHPNVDRNVLTGQKDENKDPITKDAAKDLGTAIKYARLWKDEYRKSLGNQSQLAPFLGTGLIALGAATTGLAIAGSGGTAPTILGLTGAAGVGGGAWLQSKPAQRAYIAGHNAVGCAIDAVLPLNLEGNDLYKDFAKNLRELGSDIGDLNDAMSKLKAAKKFAHEEQKQQADNALQEAEVVRTTAREAQARGFALEFQRANAGQHLVNAVDRIASQVDLAIVSNQPDIQSLTNIIGGLSAIYDQFVNVDIPEEPSSEQGSEDNQKPGLETEEDDPQPPIKDLIEDLQGKKNYLADKTSFIVSIVQGIDAAKPLTRLKECGVDVDEFTAGLTFEPSGDIDLTAGQAALEPRIIKGGKAPYVVKLTKPVEDGSLTISQPELLGPAFIVEATDKIKATQNSVYVADSSGRRQFLKINVKVAPSTGNQGGGQAKACQKLTEEEKKFLTSADQCMKLQEKLCIHKDAEFGDRTRSAISFWQVKNKEVPPSEGYGRLLNETQYKKIMANGLTCPNVVVADVKASKKYALVFRHAEDADNGRIADPDKSNPLAECTGGFTGPERDLTSKGVGDAACIGVNALGAIKDLTSYKSNTCRTARTEKLVVMHPSSGGEAQLQIGAAADLKTFLGGKAASGGPIAIFTHGDVINPLIGGMSSELAKTPPKHAEAFVIDLDKTVGELDSLVARIEHHEWPKCDGRRN